MPRWLPGISVGRHVCVAVECRSTSYEPCIGLSSRQSPCTLTELPEWISVTDANEHLYQVMTPALPQAGGIQSSSLGVEFDQLALELDGG